MKFTLCVNIICPVCGDMCFSDSIKNEVKCLKPTCDNYKIQYKLPSIELERITTSKEKDPC